MAEQRRRILLKTAATSLASTLVAGCTSTDTGQSDRTQSDESQTDSASTTSTDTEQSSTTRTDESQTDATDTTSTYSEFEDYGPWVVAVVNDLKEESAVTVRLLTPDGDLYKKEEVTLAGGDGMNVFTVTERGAYTLKTSTSFDSATAEFNACKLNTDGAVELRTNDGERRLTFHQRHADPAARTTIDDPYTCK